MARSLLALAVIVVATTQVAFAIYPSKLCVPPHRIDYGGYTPYRPQYSVGSKIQFHCDKGYKLHGPSWTVCKWDKRSYWAHPPPVCKRIGCLPLKAPQYGKVRIDGYGLSSVAYYSCDYGYSLYGPASRKCLHDGSWYGSVPICKPKRRNCPTLYAPQYGKIRVTGYGPDSVAYYTCDYGYEIHGLQSRKCLHDGSWYGKIPVCRPKKKNCPRLYAPQYGKIRVTGYGPDSVAYYSCDYGYDIYGPKSRKCQYDGSWYGKLPVCRPKRRDCPKLYAPKYGKIRVTGYGPDSLAYYSCDYGYALYGPKSRKCQYDGSWYGKVPVCRPTRRRVCPRLYAPRYGKVRVTGYGLDSKAHYSCDYGYKLYGLQWRKCLHGGSWYGKAPVCRPVKY